MQGKVVSRIPALGPHEGKLAAFLEKTPQIKGVFICGNFTGIQGTGIPHGTLIQLENNGTVTKSLLPEDQGSCVALVKILNFDSIEHVKRMRDPKLNDRFLSEVGDGPTLENNYCDSLAIDLGHEITPWKPHLGKGSIGVVTEVGKNEWEKKHYIAVALPHLPFAGDACLSISGKSIDDFAKHHYVAHVIPMMIERNVRKLVGVYAKTFNFEVEKNNDALCQINCKNELPKLSSFCYDPIVHTDDGKVTLGAKVMIAQGRKNIMLLSPSHGLETYTTPHRVQIPFGVAHLKSARQVALNEATREYYGKIAHWPGKKDKLHEKLCERVYSTHLAQSTYDEAARIDNKKSYQWISMVFGK